MDLFTTYIQKDKDESIADKVLEPCKKILSQTKKTSKYKFGKTSYYDVSIWTEYRNDFNVLYDLIFKNAYAYCEKLQMKNIKTIDIDYIWVSELNKFGSHSLHAHPNSDLSGTFYVHVEPNSADIIFNRHEFMQHTLNDFNYEQYNQYNSNEWRFPAEKGGLIIWKSDLPHSVDLNMSESRIAISFNLKIYTNENVGVDNERT
tara:strand:+ start:69 stop:677 length:609 start_codon:yes stop_codon:yes gene_type:complete